MKNHICPYCGIAWWPNDETEKHVYESYEHSGAQSVTSTDSLPVALCFAKCPQCRKVSLKVIGLGAEDNIYYSSPVDLPDRAIDLPDYVPVAIRSDYIEAVSIAEASPKASATLSRRCLQGMIHDFWGIKEKNLNAEISSLKSKVPSAQWSAIDALRKIGNIGAHMEKDINLIVDVEPNEAKSLIKLIELLIDKWYIARHDEELLLLDITEMAARKEDARKLVGQESDGK